jgi:hypothetical protein
MRIIMAAVLSLVVGSAIGSAINSAQAASEETGRWCVVNTQDKTRHCYFQRHRDCEKAVVDGIGICVPNEINRGFMPEDKSK